MIGSAAGFTFADFIVYDAPAVVIILIALIVAFRFLYGRKTSVGQAEIDAVLALSPSDYIKR